MSAPHDDDRIGDILLDAGSLQERIRELGAEIAADYAGKAPLLVAVLKGAFIFMADLSRAIDIPLEVDFMAVSSYGASTRSSGVVRIVKDLDIDLGGRHVILVEDIIDSGLTLRYLRKTLQARGPASLEVCALFVREGNVARRCRPPLRRLPHPAGIRHRLWPRRGRAVPEPARHPHLPGRRVMPGAGDGACAPSDLLAGARVRIRRGTA